MNTKKDWIVRIVIGGLLGVAVMLPLAWVFSVDLFAPDHLRTFVGARMSAIFGPLAILVECALYLALGAAVGVATLPFAEEGKELIVRSLSHYAITGALLLASFWTFEDYALGLPVTLGMYTLLYLTVWLGRWVSWCAELDAIREKLGLSPAPSPLKWRETLPHLGFAFGLCTVLPQVLALIDAPDVPVLTLLLYPYLLLPVAGFVSGMSLAKRKGFCPLYPAACGVFSLLGAAILFRDIFLYRDIILFTCPIAVAASLLGVSAGTAVRRVKRKKAGPAI